MKVVAVRDISKQVRGVTYAKSDASAVPRSGYSPILRANNIGEHGLLLEDLIFVPNTKISQKQRIVPNDIVVAASSGSISVVGKTAQARIGFEGGFGAFCKVLRPGPDVDPHYFGHYFRTSLYRHVISRLAAGVNINNLRNEHLDNLQIPLPPLAEQKRIAEILDAADALRAKRREALSEFDTLLQSTFLDMFGDPDTNPMRWESRAFGDITAAKKLGLVRSSKEFGWDFTIPYVRMDAVTATGEFLPDKVQRTEADERELKDYRLKPGDFLFNTRNSKQLVGKVCVFPGPEGWLFNNNLMRIRFCVEVEPTVIAMQFRFGRVQRELEKRKAGTTSVFAVYWKSLQTLPILVPPSDLQRRFATIVESVEQQKVRQQAHLAELNTLFASLQSRAFRGDL
ncbi:restriction endonuclease subunit S [Candidatus Palauibacter sp.]|uniref:restriction endonuclease subunit S n=1 Tax=Candidatus Palauibacter sp. TaxID=3101350 RepID=UPI003B5300BC